jgi:hypothetical protein
MVHAPGDEDPEAGTAALEKLAAELGARGFQARLLAPEGRVPSLSVINPQATALSENVVAGEGWLWWSWAERIAPVTDVSGAAAAISRVLSHGSSSL